MANIAPDRVRGGATAFDDRVDALRIERRDQI